MEKVNHYSIFEVIDRFEINKIFDCTNLAGWINSPVGTLKPAYAEVLDEARKKLELKWDEWNESQRRTVRAKNELRRQSDL